jgi:hypothetical protein
VTFDGHYFIRADIYEALPHLRWMIAGFPLGRSGFDLRTGNLGFVADEKVLGRDLFDCFRFP